MSDQTNFKLGGIGIAVGGEFDGERVYYSEMTDKCWILDPDSPFSDGDRTFVVHFGEYYPCYNASEHLDYVRKE